MTEAEVIPTAQKQVADLKPISETDFQKAIQKKNTAPVEKPAVETKIPAEVKSPEAKEEAKEGDNTEVKPEAATEEVPKRKSAKEIAKPFSKKKDAEVIAEAEVIPETLKAKFQEYEKQNLEYKSIIDDPDVKVILEAKKAGKSVIDILKEALGDAPDTKKMTDAQVYEHGLKMNGVKPASELGEDSEESSLEDEMEKFRSMGKLAQKREADTIRKDIDAGSANQTENFLHKLTSHNEKQALEASVNKKKEQALYTKTQKELNDIADAYIGNDHYAVVGTPQLAESIKNFKFSDLVRKNEDGSLNAEDVFDLFHYKLTKELRLENLENQFFSQGFDTLKKDVEVTKGAAVSIVRTPKTSQTPQTTKELHNYAVANARAVN